MADRRGANGDDVRGGRHGQQEKGGTVNSPVRGADVDDWLVERARVSMPMLPHVLAAAGSDLAKWNCEACGWTGSAAGGIPILLPRPAMAEHDELDHHHAHGTKWPQAAYFDGLREEAFEIDRPHGTPRLYRFLLAEKFRRAVGPIRPHLVGASALAVCGGSGMDAEFLARAGAAVISSDRRWAQPPGRRPGRNATDLDVRSIVADVEHLPYADQSVDLVAVHDGLHHLDDPYAGLSEMARVARRWVVLTEPAQASITWLAIRLGLALEKEAAGNRVARMDPSEVAAFLEARGMGTPSGAVCHVLPASARVRRSAS